MVDFLFLLTLTFSLKNRENWVLDLGPDFKWQKVAITHFKASRINFFV